jgi:hypothetical protein
MKCAFPVFLFAFSLSAFAAEPAGEWKAPSKDARPWKHAGTGLSFPQMLGGYRLAGEFSYKAGGCFIRYENLEEQARADIFFFPVKTPVTVMEEKQRLILQELDGVVADMRGMEKQGRYKNLDISEVAVSGIDLWVKEDLPLAIRTIDATRIGKSSEGVAEALIKQWVAVTLLDNHILTIRQMRPASTGTSGLQGLKNFGSMVIQVIKDPALRADISRMIDLYMAAPFSDDSIQARGAVLAYLKNTPFYPISIPEYPVSDWLEHCKKLAPGTEEHLLAAFMLGSAKAAFNEGDAATCMNAGAKQFAVIYRQLVAKHPDLKTAEIEAFVADAVEGHGGDWLMAKSGMKQ